MKIFNKKVFIILPIAIIFLIIGLVFIVQPTNISRSDTHSITCNFKAKWKNPNGYIHTGRYKNAQGKDPTANKQYITANARCSGGTFDDGETSLSKKNSPSSTSTSYIEFSVENDHRGGKGIPWSLNISIETDANAMFKLAGSPSISKSGTLYGYNDESTGEEVDLIGYLTPKLINVYVYIHYMDLFTDGHYTGGSELHQQIPHGFWKTSTLDELKVYAYESLNFTFCQGVKSLEEELKYFYGDHIKGFNFGYEVFKNNENKTQNVDNDTFLNPVIYNYRDSVSPTHLEKFDFYNNNSFGEFYVPVNSIIIRPFLTPKHYTIYFNKNGGTGGDYRVDTTFYKELPSVTIPTRAGYNFNGYWTKPEGGTQYYNSSGKPVKCFHAEGWDNYLNGMYYDIVGDTTFYARWIPANYYVAFDANGGSGSMAQQTIQYGSSTKLTANAYTKTGYSFAGWATSATGSVAYSNSQSVINLTIAGSTINLYAKWTAESYTFIFNKGLTDATMSPNNSSASYTYRNTYNSSSSPKFPSWSRTGYTFNGWKLGYNNATYTTSFKVENDFSGTTDSQRTFTAQYTANTYKIRFNGNGSTSGSMSDLSMTYGSSKNLSANAFVRTGYTFAGWNTQANGSGTSYTNSQSVSNLSSTNGAIVNLYAKWTPITYTIAFNANSGSGSMSSITKTYATSIKLPGNTFTRKNYLFKGWSTTSTGSVVYTNAQSLTTDLSSTKNATVTLYAVWEETWANQYTVPTGSGTSAAPYLISTPQHLAWLANQTNNGKSLSGYFKQTANINLDNYEWLPIGNASYPFLGKYDGNGYTISNISVNTIPGVNRNHLGLFGYTHRATIQNVVIISGNVGSVGGSSWHTGGIVGYGAATTIQNCVNFASVNGGNDQLGGIAGIVSSSTIKGCQNYGDVTGNLWVGGILGDSRDTTVVENCYVKCNLTAKSNYDNYGGCNGGIVGAVRTGSLKISGCAFEGNLYYGQEGSQTNQGAILGAVSGGTAEILNCYAKATLTTVNNHGLVTGKATITDCVMEINGKKYCKGSSFSGWVINVYNIPVPTGLTWIATGGTKVTSYTQITGLGFTQV